MERSPGAVQLLSWRHARYARAADVSQGIAVPIDESHSWRLCGMLPAQPAVPEQRRCGKGLE